MSKKINIAKNLVFLRKSHQYTIEEVADKVNVSRQAIAKWESGNSVPDLTNCAALADLYDISVDDLIFSTGKKATDLPPKGKQVFGTVIVQKDGTIKLPVAAVESYKFIQGTKLALLGNEIGLALIPEKEFLLPLEKLMRKFYPQND